MLVFEVSLYDNEGNHKVKYVASDNQKLFERFMDNFIAGEESLVSYRKQYVHIMSENDERISLIIRKEFYEL